MSGKPLFYLFLAIGALIFLSWFFSDIFIYTVIAIVVSSILRPLTQYIANTQFLGLRVPRLIAVIFSYIILVMFLTSFVILFIPLISEQIEVISRLNYQELYNNLSAPLKNVEIFLINNNLTTKENGFIVDNLKENIVTIISNVQFGNVINDIIAVTGSILVGILAVSFISFFLLYEMGSMRKKLISLVPNRYFEVTIAAYNKIERLLSNYLIGLLFQIFAIFSIASLGLSILGIKYALTIALFAAVANLIPYLGPLLGACFGVIVGVSTGNDLTTTHHYLFLILKIGSVFATVQIVDNIFLQPLIFSKSVKAHPLEIFIIIFAGASIAGIPGMILAIPVYTVIRVSFSELYQGYRSYTVFKTQKTKI